MSEKNKVMVEVLSTVVLPKLKGLSEKNAKKLMDVSEKALGQIAKKYHHLLKEQAEKEAQKKEKALKKDKKEAEKLAKKNEKLARQSSTQKKLDLLLNIKADSTVKPAVVTAKKPVVAKK